MDKIRVVGGKKLKGQIPIAGSKNTALALMPLCILTDEPFVLSNIPDVADIKLMIKLLESLGVEIEELPTGSEFGRKLKLTATEITGTTAPYDIVSKMRASFWVLAPLLARVGKAEVSLPGGCAIGARPVDFHLSAMEHLGAEIKLANGYVNAKVPKKLKGARMTFPAVSVGATISMIMAAAVAEGTTTVMNSAGEPDVVNVANCLNAMGAKIEGAGSNTIKITGVPALKGVEHRVVSDRIEAGTYMMAAAITDGDIELIGAPCEHLSAVVSVLESAGVEFTYNKEKDSLRVRRSGKKLNGIDVITEPYPGFPTDLQAQIMAMLTIAEGSSMITETIFENRFMHVPELCRMGANIHAQTNSAIVRGEKELIGAQVMATDLRASVSLILAGLVAKGETIVSRVYHLDRGFEKLEKKLQACGAEIERIKSV
ncbi:MAG: UDP-N-acetylglucosamine 1-carboxyvinyltransferase [Alphaproteobacteria bacterium]